MMLICWIMLFLHGVFTLPVCLNQQNSKDYVILSALLPLHSGDDCSETQIRGIQQLAALEYGLNKVNADLNQYGDLKISLQVLDTCSNSNKALKATMKGLVAADQTCIKSPLFLGYVGPDNLESFINVHKITSLLNKTHILPYKIDLKEKPANVFFIGLDQTEYRAKAIITILKNLGWESYISVTEDSIQAINLSGVLIDLSDDGQICPIGKPIILPKLENGHTVVYKQIMEYQEHTDGIVVIVEKPEALKSLLKIILNSVKVTIHRFVVYIITVGLKLWELPKSDTLNMIIMQESTEFNAKKEIKQYYNDSLIISYHEQTQAYKRNCKNDPMCLDSFEDELDSSVTPITYSVYLFANALKMSIDQKCKYNLRSTGICRNLQSMSTTEWMPLLRSASTIINGADGPKRIRFQMETVHHVSIYTWNTIATQYDLIATMMNGDRLNFIKNIYLTPSIRTTRSNHPSSCQSYKTKLSITTTETLSEESTSVKEDDWSPIWEFLPNSEKNPKMNDNYQTVIVILCICFGFLIFMLVAIRMLYNLFKFNQGNDESSNKKKKKSSKKPRRSSSVVSRRLSRTSSIISTRSN